MLLQVQQYKSFKTFTHDHTCRLQKLDPVDFGNGWPWSVFVWVSNIRLKKGFTNLDHVDLIQKEILVSEYSLASFPY